MLKTIYDISFWVISLTVIVVLFGFAKRNHEERICNRIGIDIADKEIYRFVKENKVHDIINNLGYNVLGKKIQDIDIDHLEFLLNGNPYVKKAEVYTTIDGALEVNIHQKEPLLRVFNENGESFYLDNEGTLLPLSNQFSARVLVATGNIKLSYSHMYSMLNSEVKPFLNEEYYQKIASKYKKTPENSHKNDSILEVLQFADLYRIAHLVSESDFWSRQIAQLYVNEKSEIELIPKVGNHKIIVGDSGSLSSKLEKLMIFYKKGLNKTGWNEFSTINLKYKNQVVCTKK